MVMVMAVLPQVDIMTDGRREQFCEEEILLGTNEKTVVTAIVEDHETADGGRHHQQHGPPARAAMEQQYCKKPISPGLGQTNQGLRVLGAVLPQQRFQIGADVVSWSDGAERRRGSSSMILVHHGLLRGWGGGGSLPGRALADPDRCGIDGSVLVVFSGDEELADRRSGGGHKKYDDHGKYHNEELDERDPQISGQKDVVQRIPGIGRYRRETPYDRGEKGRGKISHRADDNVDDERRTSRHV